MCKNPKIRKGVVIQAKSIPNSICDAMCGLSEIINNIAEMQTIMSAELSKIDKEIVDINHYIEFENLNASQGYKAYKMLKERLRARREMKDTLQYIQIISASGICEKNLEKARKGINTYSVKAYTPRLLNELFEKGDKDD